MTQMQSDPIDRDAALIALLPPAELSTADLSTTEPDDEVVLDEVDGTI